MRRFSKIINLPNVITGGRFILSGCLAFLLLQEQTNTIGLIAWLVFSIAAGSDWIDGYFARKYKAVTVLGQLMDPLADKVLVTTALVMLVADGKLPAWLALIILCREIIVTGLRGVASSSGIVVSASSLGKWKSTLQYIGLGILIFPPDILFIKNLHEIGLIVMYFALVLTVWSGIDYFYKLRKIFLVEVQ
ncbi:CDP-diacylglycerol--glycerol-3-phosphate 3-phosphatidyltransferase [Desulfobulbus oligotrophicus]|uniref:CDP-diacylglycerol--glycerol-3-phosphate 3-phosphatidyltransferase n=1 Tax=Desulfobulbus oligotrophicus TaxID=1909699 RepID=A0A7T6APS6_9BACT|nr:CDP-diacylglycerol--glycerol-3-phosphate 3-phosphatidyltransferase [Desulfobulbus oligotrophicus]MDY0390542.1 CDP-diacylglycerol--glycerol-3-phosphate 3-phosphatidyltransferase [Desulfobulbus oligotrophicus]QQG64833.1 CDP-diacylglycerol--glycerol-3-phosphate 3-phosphatidyltransferase [Desulfobulbus oligotrophicus]